MGLLLYILLFMYGSRVDAFENENIIQGWIPTIFNAHYSTNTQQYGIDFNLLTDGLTNKSNCQNLIEVPKTVHLFVFLRSWFNIKALKFYMLFDNVPDDEHIILQFEVKSDFLTRQLNFSVSVDGSYFLPYSQPSYHFGFDIEFVYSNVSSSAKAYVCELEVIGCPWGSYGTPCRRCNNPGCRLSNCDPFDGSCLCTTLDPNSPCPQGSLCNPGLYGKYCNQNCSSHCNTSFECHQGNGTCIGGCQDGWSSDECDIGKVSTNFETLNCMTEHTHIF